jgi:hypothetical protein
MNNVTGEQATKSVAEAYSKMVEETTKVQQINEASFPHSEFAHAHSTDATIRSDHAHLHKRKGDQYFFAGEHHDKAAQSAKAAHADYHHFHKNAKTDAERKRFAHMKNFHKLNSEYHSKMSSLMYDHAHSLGFKPHGKLPKWSGWKHGTHEDKG